MSSLRFWPARVSSLRARLPAALIHFWSLPIRNPEEIAANRPENVFDFSSGLRLGISVWCGPIPELFATQGRKLHIVGYWTCAGTIGHLSCHGQIRAQVYLALRMLFPGISFDGTKERWHEGIMTVFFSDDATRETLKIAGVDVEQLTKAQVSKSTTQTF